MKLSEYLSEKNLTDAEFGSIVGRDRSSISRMRRGETKPDWETLERIYAATGGEVRAEDFFQAQPTSPFTPEAA